MEIRLNVKNAYARSHLSSDRWPRCGDTPFLRLAATLRLAPLLLLRCCQGTKEQIMLDLVLKNSSHSKSHNITRGHTFPPTRGHAATGASPSPACCQGTKEQMMLDLDLKNINSHSKPHRIYPSILPPSVDCCVPRVT